MNIGEKDINEQTICHFSDRLYNYVIIWTFQGAMMSWIPVIIALCNKDLSVLTTLNSINY